MGAVKKQKAKKMQAEASKATGRTLPIPASQPPPTSEPADSEH